MRRRLLEARRWLSAERPARPVAAGSGRLRRPSRWWHERRAAADSALALALAAAVTPQMVFHVRVGDPLLPWYLGLSALLIAPLAVRRHAPMRVFLGVAAVGGVQWVVGVQLAADAAILVALATVAASYPWRGTLLAAGICELGAGGASARWPHGLRPSEMFVVLSVFVLAATATGAYVRSRQRVIAMLQQQSGQLRRDRDQRARFAVIDERRRIARDMHDVVGHGLAVIVTLAAGNAGKASRHPARVDRAVDLIEQTARAALADTRQVLGAVRTATDTDLRPTSGIADLPALVDTAAATGLLAALVTSGPLAEVPTAVGLAVYRISQEAVTNVLKHADATRVDVRLDVTSDRVVLTVEDDGVDRGEALGSRVGSGLVSIRERAHQVGGTVRVGPGPERGWQVEATMPTASTLQGGPA